KPMVLQNQGQIRRAMHSLAGKRLFTGEYLFDELLARFGMGYSSQLRRQTRTEGRIVPVSNPCSRRAVFPAYKDTIAAGCERIGPRLCPIDTDNVAFDAVCRYTARLIPGNILSPGQ